MARSSKRRSWTTSDVGALKTLARRKTRAVRIARTLKRHRRCYSAKGVQPWIIAQFTSTGLISGSSLHRRSPATGGFFYGPVDPKRHELFGASTLALMDCLRGKAKLAPRDITILARTTPEDRMQPTGVSSRTDMCAAPFSCVGDPRSALLGLVQFLVHRAPRVRLAFPDSHPRTPGNSGLGQKPK